MEVGRFLNADDVDYQGSKAISTNLFTFCLNNLVNDTDIKGNIPTAVIGAVFSAVVSYVLYWVEWKCGLRKWSWKTLAAIVAVNAAMGAFDWAVSGGSIPKIKKCIGLIQKHYLPNGREVRIVKAIYYARRKVINQLMTVPTRKKGESWLNYIRKHLNRISSKLK